MAEFLHTMVRITDPSRSRAFYEALGFTFEREMDIVRNGEKEATNYFFGIGEDSSPLWGRRGSSRNVSRIASATAARCSASSATPTVTGSS
jgi:catechol 2,3-dioxygenase-like lactoylglutathione lyase family enzyme